MQKTSRPLRVEGYPVVMSVGYDHYPELHALIERLQPEQADELRRHALRLVGADEVPPAHRLSFTGIGVSANQHLGAEAKQIIRRDLRGVDE
jgi:hypothetical protein